MKNRGEKFSRYLSFSGYEYFYFTNKEKGSKAIKSLENAMKSEKETRPIKPLRNPLIIKKATGGLLKNSSKPLGIGKALRGWGKGYK